MGIDVTNLLDYLELGLILSMQSWNSQMKVMHLLLLQKAGCISPSVKYDKRYFIKMNDSITSEKSGGTWVCLMQTYKRKHQHDTGSVLKKKL